jgi:Cof subfamily protein (haloacid dehalogenase superfamily)
VIRLLAVDLDGTLVSVDLRLDPRDVEAVRRAEAAGVRVVACTGRPFPGALPWARKLGLESPLVCYQGAQVRTPDGGMLLDHGVPHDLAMEVIRLCRAEDLHVQAYRDDQLVVERDRPEAQEYARHSGMAVHVVGDLDAAMGETTPKLVIVAATDVVERWLPELRRRWESRLYVATSLPHYIEITNPDADKRQALEWLCRRFGVDREDAAAIGDGRNDQPMIEWAGAGYAVEGAPPEVVAAAGGRTVGAPGTGGFARLVEALIA